MGRLIWLGGYLLMALPAFTQIAADCTEAVKIPLSRELRSLSTDEVPRGRGRTLEIEAPRSSPYFFHQEHHSAWYQFVAPFSGTLTFDVIPHDPQSDYDFILFVDSSGNFCESLRAGPPLPLRSVISRRDDSLAGRTGLRLGARRPHINEGPGPSYAPPVEVQRGQRYYLVLDNVYGDGRGHRLDFHYYLPMRLRGLLYQAGTRQPLEGNVWLERTDTGAVVDSARSDLPGETYNYHLTGLIEYGAPYQLRYEAEAHHAQPVRYRWQPKVQSLDVPLRPFFQMLQGQVRAADSGEPLAAQIWLVDSTERRLDSLRSDSLQGRFTVQIPDSLGETRLLFRAEGYFDKLLPSHSRTHRGGLIAELRPSAVGESLIFGEINFYGGQAIFLPEARDELQELLRIMQDHPTLRIQIEGHVNGANMPGPQDQPEWQDLSERRAAAVKNYLVQRGIKPTRMETIGYAATRMLYPRARGDGQMARNRRVEIKILGYE